MKKYLLLLLPLVLFSCASLEKMPVENKQVVIDLKDNEELVITETYSCVKELTASVDEPAITENHNIPEIEQNVHSAERNFPPVLKDTIRIESSQTAEALDSERVARNAHIWSFMPLTGLIFWPGFFVGLIVTLVLLAKIKRYSYVTPATLEYQRRARRTLFITTVGLLLLLIVLIIVLIGLIFLFW